MTASRDILILSASAGAGHMMAARALEHAFRAAAPDASVEVLDVLSICNGAFRKLYAGGYSGLVRYAPAAMGWLYDAMDRPGRRAYNAIRLLVQDLNKLPITRYVRQCTPRLIVHTHYLPAEIVAQMRRAGELRCPQVTVTTDFETHRLWVEEPTERYYTATAMGKAYLTTWGVDPQRVLVTGIPVRPGFLTAVPLEAARRRCELAVDRPVVLLLAGGFDTGATAELARELLSLPSDVQIVVLAGRNARLRRRLDALAGRSAHAIRVLGFTDQVHVWMQAADLVVTKPGGLTVSESLACALPMVIMNPIPGQETRNSDYLLEQGAAIKVNNPRLLGHRVEQLLRDPPRLGALRDAARRIARPQAARDIAADALQIMAQPPLNAP